MSSFNDYTILNQIGKGGYAEVYKAVHNQTQQTVAIKILEKDISNKMQLMQILDEIELSKKLKHPFICQHFDSFEHDKKIYIVMEYAEGDTLLDHINNTSGLSEKDALIYFAEMLSALNYLHQNNIVHRDLKAENVLFDSNGKLRLIDFGLSKEVSADTIMTTRCGSPAYVSPEMIKGEPYSMGTDIWSLGIILFAIVAYRLPFEDNNIKNLFNMILFQKIVYPEFFSANLIDLLSSMLEKDQEQRIKLKSIIEHPWAKARSNIMRLTQKDIPLNEQKLFSKLEELGFDEKSIREELEENLTTRGTVSYQIVRRSMETEELNKYVNKLLTIPPSLITTRLCFSRKAINITPNKSHSSPFGSNLVIKRRRESDSKMTSFAHHPGIISPVPMFK